MDEPFVMDSYVSEAALPKEAVGPKSHVYLAGFGHQTVNIAVNNEHICGILKETVG